METVKTLKLRIKDKHAKVLLAMARDVNTVWNFCNETQYPSLRRYTNKPQRWLSGFDLQKLTNGFSKCDGVYIGSSTQQAVCEEFATRLRQFKKQRLNWRVSNKTSPKYSLGWIPFKKGALTYKNGQVRFKGIHMSLWDSYGLSKYEFRAGSFNEDSRGRWYLNSSECGATHDRDTNAAKNILAAGLRRLAAGIPALLGRGGSQHRLNNSNP